MKFFIFDKADETSAESIVPKFTKEKANVDIFSNTDKINDSKDLIFVAHSGENAQTFLENFKHNNTKIMTIGGLTPQQFAEGLAKKNGNNENLKKNLQHIYLVSCEAGLKIGETCLAQQIADELYKKGFTSVQIHAVTTPVDAPTAGMRVKIIHKTGASSHVGRQPGHIQASAHTREQEEAAQLVEECDKNRELNDTKEIRSTLEKAKESKNYTSIKPFLSTAEIKEELDRPHNTFLPTKSPNYRVPPPKYLMQETTIRNIENTIKETEDKKLIGNLENLKKGIRNVVPQTGEINAKLDYWMEPIRNATAAYLPQDDQNIVATTTNLIIKNISTTLNSNFYNLLKEIWKKIGTTIEKVLEEEAEKKKKEKAEKKKKGKEKKSAERNDKTCIKEKKTNILNHLSKNTHKKKKERNKESENTQSGSSTEESSRDRRNDVTPNKEQKTNPLNQLNINTSKEKKKRNEKLKNTQSESSNEESVSVDIEGNFLISKSHKNNQNIFENELNHYIINRKNEATGTTNIDENQKPAVWNRQYLTFFGPVFGTSAGVKISATQKLLDAIEFEKRFNQVLMLGENAELPRQILDNQLVAQLNDNRLTIYWSDNNKIKTRVFAVNTESDFYKLLPKKGEFSNDADIIKRLRPKFDADFTNDEIIALYNDRLGAIVKAHRDELPEAFLESEKERYYNLSRRSY